MEASDALEEDDGATHGRHDASHLGNSKWWVIGFPVCWNNSGSSKTEVRMRSLRPSTSHQWVKWTCSILHPYGFRPYLQYLLHSTSWLHSTYSTYYTLHPGYTVPTTPYILVTQYLQYLLHSTSWLHSTYSTYYTLHPGYRLYLVHLLHPGYSTNYTLQPGYRPYLQYLLHPTSWLHLYFCLSNLE